MLISNIERQTGLITEIQSVTGGIPPFDDDFDPDPYFKPSDYDQTLEIEQLSLQQPYLMDIGPIG